MLDLETWGTEPGCDIRSIGACVFDLMTGVVYDGGSHQHGNSEPFYVAVGNPILNHHVIDRRQHANLYDPTSNCYRKYPLTRDPRTVQWWSEQSDEAQAAFANPVELREGLEQFTICLNSICTPDSIPPSGGHTNLRLWSHGPAFDPPILAAAYRACNLPVPWHYRTLRDTRTCFDLAGIDDHSAWLSAHPGPLGIPHHALDDAICQARAVCKAIARIGEQHDRFNDRTTN